jgi:hypothetical protein
MTCAKGGHKPNISRCMPGAGLNRSLRGKVLPCMPLSNRIGENPPCGMIGRVEETSALLTGVPWLPATWNTGARAATGHAVRPPSSVTNSRLFRGRDASCLAPPAQIRTGGFPAYGSHLGYRRQ